MADRPRVTIREARPDDWTAIWPFFHQIVAAGETYAYDRDMDEAAGRQIWMVGPPGRTVVATDPGGAVLGSANMYANRGGPGSHVASASFMVDPQRSGLGVGRALGEHVIEWARDPDQRSRGVRAPQARVCGAPCHASISLMRDYVRLARAQAAPKNRGKRWLAGDEIARPSDGQG